MSYLNCCQVYLRILKKLKICTLRSFTIVDTTKQEFRSSIASNLLHVDTFLLLMKKSLKWYFLPASLQKWILF